jgi:hypothetical protein
MHVQGGVTPLHLAAKSGHVAALHAMLTTERVETVAEEFAEDLWDVLTGQSTVAGHVNVNSVKDDVM